MVTKDKEMNDLRNEMRQKMVKRDNRDKELNDLRNEVLQKLIKR